MKTWLLTLTEICTDFPLTGKGLSLIPASQRIRNCAALPAATYVPVICGSVLKFKLFHAINIPLRIRARIYSIFNNTKLYENFINTRQRCAGVAVARFLDSSEKKTKAQKSKETGAKSLGPRNPTELNRTQTQSCINCAMNPFWVMVKSRVHTIEPKKKPPHPTYPNLLEWKQKVDKKKKTIEMWILNIQVQVAS